MQVRNKIHAYVALFRHFDRGRGIFRLHGAEASNSIPKQLNSNSIFPSAVWLLLPAIAGSGTTCKHNGVVIINFTWPEAISLNYLMQCVRWWSTCDIPRDVFRCSFLRWSLRCEKENLWFIAFSTFHQRQYSKTSHTESQCMRSALAT